jgi:hypothetical protein
MSFNEKVAKAIFNLNNENHIKRIIEETEKTILAGVGRRMLEEQRQQLERFTNSLEDWDKKIEATINAKIDAAINKKINGQ